MNTSQSLISRISFLSFFLAGCLTISISFAGKFDKVQIKAHPVSQTIYMLEGAGGNIGICAGEDGIFMIDAQFAELAERIEASLGEIHSGQLRFLLNTHWHQDHTSGNAFFGWKVPIMAHENVRKRLMSIQTRGERKFDPAPKQAWPILTYKESIKLHFNNEEIHIVHFPTGHTDGDSIVFFKNSNVIHMGDHFFNGKFPFVDMSSGGTVEGYLDNVLNVIKRAPDDVKIIPGHGPLANLSDLKIFAHMIQETRKIILKRKQKGMSRAKIFKLGLPETWSSWGTGFISTQKWIETLLQN